MNRVNYFRIFLAFLFGLMVFQGRDACAFSVEKIRFGVHPGKVRMVLDLSEVADFRVFVLSSPYRLVIDLPHFQWNAGSVDKPSSSAISGIRQGALNPAISRIVFDLTSPAAVESAFLLESSGDLPNRLVIDYAKVPESVFDAQKGRILGSLNSGSSMPPARVQEASAAMVAAPPPVSKPPVAAKPPEDKPLIVIDPGHGGKDPGAIAAGNIYEKNITLAAAKELKRQLLATGRYRVRLTRETDVFLKLSERVAIARDLNADLFISIHADSMDNSGVSGASVYTLSKKASDAQTARLAEKENRADLIGMDLSGEDEDVAIILTDLLVTDTMNQSKFLANTLTDEMASGGTRLLPNPHRSAGFAVLKSPDIPSVLIEIGFLSNNREARMLENGDYRSKVLASVRKGIDAYFERARKNSRT